MDADVIRAAMPSPPISGGAAADRIADALGTPNVIGEKTNVTAFVVRRFVDRGLLVDLGANPDGTLHHPARCGGLPGARTWRTWSPPTPRSVPSRPPPGSG